MKNEKWTKWIPILIVGFILIFFYKTLDNLSSISDSITRFLKVVSPFLYSILIVYFLYIPCIKLEELYKKSEWKFFEKHSRLLSVLSVYLILALAIIFIMVIVIPIIIANILDLANSIPGYIDNIVTYINNTPETSIWNSYDVQTHLTNFANSTLSQMFDANRIEQFTKSIIGFANGIISVFISIVVSLYILLDRDKIADFFNSVSSVVFSPKAKERTTKYLNRINEVLFTFIASKGLDSIINFVCITSILFILNVKYAFLLGIIAALANFIPYLGSLMSAIFITFITLITGGIGKAVSVLIFLIIFQQIDANFVEPKIMGHTLNISPILVIFAVIVGGAYFGILGMFLAVPIITMLKQVALEYIEHRRNKQMSKIDFIA